MTLDDIVLISCWYHVFKKVTFEQYMEITGINSALRIAVLMAAGGFIGALVTFKVMQTSNCRVLYLSQNELMELERARIAKEKLEDQQLFYGKQADAVKLATELPK
jgi:hypothetical protein